MIHWLKRVRERVRMMFGQTGNRESRLKGTGWGDIEKEGRVPMSGGYDEGGPRH